MFQQKCGLTSYALYSAVSWRNPCLSDQVRREHCTRENTRS